MTSMHYLATRNGNHSVEYESRTNVSSFYLHGRQHAAVQHIEIICSEMNTEGTLLTLGGAPPQGIHSASHIATLLSHT
jgi:hypothetical protein